ncbi:MAG: type IV secretory system conjugative DNA transfer family protein [Oscillospiraceae bacterium]|jgi:type IV secretion system protein VirD4|nr:type IV secretory system conjugative DNA transfer family protein [Oscillospiraceae bacterium]
MTRRKAVKRMLPYVPCLLIFFVVAILWATVRRAGNMEAALNALGRIFDRPLPALGLPDILAGLICAAVIAFVIKQSSVNSKKYRHGVEHGSARWGTKRDIKPYMSEIAEQNIILTKTEGLTMESRPKNPKFARNKNVLVIGGSGSGKTRFFMKPQLMQLHSSYVITDPKGQTLAECGRMLKRAGYKIKTLNTIDFTRSMHYNPFDYIRSDKDILKFVTALIANTKKGEKGGEDFWVQAETLLYIALISYLHYEAPPEEQNLNTLVDMINSMEVREEDETYKNAVDLLMEDLENENPDHIAVRQYKKYKLAAGKTAKSILISCGARLAPFDISELRELISYDEMELDTLGDRKTALFIIISDTDATFNFLAALMYSQMFNLLCDKADMEYGGRLPVHVRCLLDEFANIGKIPDFEKLIATIRSREISACVILQSQSQLKSIYKDDMNTIIGNCDTQLFLGGKEADTAEGIVKSLGKETIHDSNTNRTRGSQSSSGVNYQKLGRELMTADELAVMDGGKCILQIRGARPFFSDKYDITKHKNYRQLSDYDKRNAFDIRRYLSCELRFLPDEEYITIAIDPEETEEAVGA